MSLARATCLYVCYCLVSMNRRLRFRLGTVPVFRRLRLLLVTVPDPLILHLLFVFLPVPRRLRLPLKLCHYVSHMCNTYPDKQRTVPPCLRLLLGIVTVSRRLRLLLGVVPVFRWLRFLASGNTCSARPDGANGQRRVLCYTSHHLESQSLFSTAG